MLYLKIRLFGTKVRKIALTSNVVQSCAFKSRKSLLHPPPRRPVGTLGLSVRCVKGYSVQLLSILAGSTTDAQTVRPYRAQ